jgi:hypothetical protein
MAKKRTVASPYCSPTTGEFCTAPQYIAEIVCLRAFKKFEIGDPSYKFWNKEQQDRYKATVMPASVLVKEFGDKAVLDYLNGAGWNIAYIGYFKKIPDYILAGVQKSKEKLDALANVKIEKEVIEEFVKPKPVAKKQAGLFGKLKNIDG